jgi:hypothetical protein
MRHSQEFTEPASWASEEMDNLALKSLDFVARDGA